MGIPRDALALYPLSGVQLRAKETRIQCCPKGPWEGCGKDFTFFT